MRKPNGFLGAALAGLALFAALFSGGKAVADNLDSLFLSRLGDQTVASPGYENTEDGQRLIAAGKDVCARLRVGTPVVATDQWGDESALIRAAVSVYCPEFKASPRDFG
ncbi:DUF732 domain-containing protein [Nocardia aurantiaca]|uniref:DUF732 domain-containing protein n=1 Tax=Nocardia aurantiaca TaxID=2675850 RepID=A0A6I3KU88_9NOCA|nr:DUF732 domain-containing protein [Nocardia aurantiaca]MTE12941.1 DUF732 domain-containing protein [Nocardia aurantiaca]